MTTKLFKYFIFGIITGLFLINFFNPDEPIIIDDTT